MSEKSIWEKQPVECEYSFFQNKNCEFFPCHTTKHPESFNCLFCYCPLYALGSNCGGNFKWLDNGIKDCSACMVPHQRDSYSYITKKFEAISDLAKKNR